MTPAAESLLESALLAWRLAPQLCRKNPATGTNCSSGHDVWQCLKFMGLLAPIEPRRDFYVSALQGVGGAERRPRILISGAADYGMLDFVHASFGPRGIVPDITVTDLCETPLAVNRWYADRVPCDIRAVCCSILDLDEGAPFDAVCTDYFLSRFPAAQRSALLGKWRALLRPGGSVITANRLRPASEGETVRFSVEQVEHLRSAALRVAREMRPVLGLDPETFAGRVALFAAGYITHAVHTPGEVRALFEDSGFHVSRLSVENAPPAGGAPGVSGPAMRGDARHFLTVVARRQD